MELGAASGDATYGCRALLTSATRDRERSRSTDGGWRAYWNRAGITRATGPVVRRSSELRKESRATIDRNHLGGQGLPTRRPRDIRAGKRDAVVKRARSVEPSVAQTRPMQGAMNSNKSSASAGAGQLLAIRERADV